MHSHYLGPTRSLTVEGEARERARQQGLACAGEMDRAASSIGSLVVGPRYFGERAHEKISSALLAAAGAVYLAKHRAALIGHASGKFFRAQQGLAEGAGKTLPGMYGLGAVPEIAGAQMGYTLGCSAIAIGAEATGSGAPRIAYNHDFPPRFGRYNFVRRNHPTDAFASVCLTYPIMVGCLAGVNEHGLAITLNHAFSTDFDGKPGLLLTSLVQDCLDRCRTAEEAADLLVAAPVTNGALLTLADRGGRRAVVERSCTSASVRRAEGPLLVTFNKYRVPSMERFEIPVGAVSTGLIPGIPLHESNLERQRRWDELERELPSTIDEATIRRVMTDHRGGAGDKNTICRHGDELSETLWSAILDTERLTLRVVFGHACDGDYVEHGIDRPDPRAGTRPGSVRPPRPFAQA